MPKPYHPNKVPMESKMDARYPGKAHNDRFLNVEKAGSLGNGVMGHASKPMQVNPAPNYDISRVRYEDSDYRGTPEQAFHYDY